MTALNDLSVDSTVTIWLFLDYNRSAVQHAVAGGSNNETDGTPRLVKRLNMRNQVKNI
jgi:hypothetical protein